MVVDGGTRMEEEQCDHEACTDSMWYAWFVVPEIGQLAFRAAKQYGTGTGEDKHADAARDHPQDHDIEQQVTAERVWRAMGGGRDGNS